MTRLWLSLLLAAGAGCATQAGPSGTEPPPPAGGAAESAPAAEKTREVTIESFAEVADCRRHVATGTRIAVERCAADDTTGAGSTEYEIMRQDVESMRQQQVYREQVRQAAEAARRRGAF